MEPFTLTIIIRGLIAFVLAGGGIYALNRGYSLFANKIGLKPDESVFAFGRTRISVKSVGALVMVTASFWGYLSFQCVPRTEGAGMKVASASDAQKELVELRAAITRAILTSQNEPIPQKVFQVSLSSTIESSLIDGPKGRVGKVAQISYDARGRVIEIKRDRSTTRFEYDDMDRLIMAKYSGPDIGFASGYTPVSYSYDATGNRLSMTTTPDSETRYEYSPTGKLASIESKPKKATP